MTNYRAAYIKSPQSSTSGGFVLTTPEQASLSDDDLIAEAKSFLAEYSASAKAIGEAEATESDILIGEWRE